MFVSDVVGDNDADPFAMDGITPSTLDVSSIATPTTSTGTSSVGMSKDDVLFRSMSLHSSPSSSRQPRTLAPNLTRRSHKKSRAGCFTCKSRKIKCGEQKPKCGNCLLKGLSCVYPLVDAPRRREHAPLQIAKRAPAGGSPGTAAFTMLDMRFFHHFLTTAYPHLPIGNDHVWVNEIPQFAESHEYLMHAILSLGASHLSRLTGIDYRKESLTHRGQAIAGLNQALSQPAQHYGESDAMLAACYALTFQASYMGDGLADFITMVRGCALTTGKIRDEGAATAFNLQPDWHFKVMAPRLANLPRVNATLLEDGFDAIETVRPYLVTETDRDFQQALADVIGSLLQSPQSGYLQFIGVYAVWYELCHDAFKSFLDPNNLIAQLLLAYFVGIQLLMVPLAAHEWPERADSSKIRVLYGTIEWAHAIFERLEDSDLKEHLAWPKRIASIVVNELENGQSKGPSVLMLELPINSVLNGDGSSEGSPLPGGFWEEAVGRML